MVPEEGVEPSLARLSFWCLYHLGYSGFECTPWGSNPAKSVCGTDAVSSWLGVHEKLRSRESNPVSQAYETRWGVRPLSAIKRGCMLPAGFEPATVRLGRARSSSAELRKLRVPLAGIEPAASRVGAVRSHPLSYKGKKKRSRQDSNLRPHGSQPCALIQLSYGTKVIRKWTRRDSNPGRSGASRGFSR